MQHSPYEIKEKLLGAIDQEYNVVDMAAVLEVISLLEKASITKDALEKTRIGKYVNELRKKTNNEQLSKRAKDLVKAWRKLLPQPESSINGERVICNTGTPPVGMTSLGPGPGPGFGPGPGPGNRSLKSGSAMSCGSRYKPSSPIVVSERTTSPFCSSASNSPLLPTSKLQGSNRPTTPSSYAPLTKATLSHTAMRSTNRTIFPNQNLLNSGSQGKSSTTSSQIFKPVSPALAALRHASNRVLPGSPANSMAHPKPHSPTISPVHRNNSRSHSPHVNATGKTGSSRHVEVQNSNRNVLQSSVSPPTLSGSSHSSLDIARTNAANKRLRKNDASDNNMPSKKTNFALKNNCLISNSNLVNGLDFPEHSEGVMPSESSAFESFNLSKSCKPGLHSDRKSISDSVKSEKRKRHSEKYEVRDPLKDKISASSGSKLPKVKTTQQLIAELQAKKGDATLLNIASLTDTPLKCEPSFSLLSRRSGSLHSSDAEVSRTKSELMQRFLIGEFQRDPKLSDSHIASSNHGSPTAISSVSSPFEESASHTVPDNCSVINTERDASASYKDSVSEEINKLLSSLPVVNSDEVSLEEESLPERTEIDTGEGVKKIALERWEYVNGNYDSDGTWRPWEECCEKESYTGESFRILPYVNIDW